MAHDADTGKPKRKRVRDARQQTLNKLAQIRYRCGCHAQQLCMPTDHRRCPTLLSHSRLLCHSSEPQICRPCRDRKRQKTKTLEEQVKQLQDKVAGLHKSQADRQALQQQNAGLQQELQGKLVELKGARATSSSDSMDSSRHVLSTKTPEPSLQQLAKKWLDTARPLHWGTTGRGGSLNTV